MAREIETLYRFEEFCSVILIESICLSRHLAGPEKIEYSLYLFLFLSVKLSLSASIYCFLEFCVKVMYII